MEAEAFTFGAEFLFPGESLKKEWPTRATLSNLEPLKHRWGMSIAALIEHGHNHGLLTDERRTSLYRQLSHVNPRTGVRWSQQEPGWDARTPERPVTIADARSVAFDTTDPVRITAQLSDAVAAWDPGMLRLLLSGFDTAWSREIKQSVQQEARYTALIPTSDGMAGYDDGAAVIDLFSRRVARAIEDGPAEA